MPQDAFSLYHISSELNSLLSGAKINKVTQPNQDEVYLLTYSKLGTKTLVLSANASTARIAFSNFIKPNPISALNFCMLLRKHLQGGTIEKISLIGFERIVVIDIVNNNDFREQVKKQLVVEIMGKYSNIFLLENNKILGCLKPAPLDVATKRLLLTGSTYKLPTPQDKVEITDKESCILTLAKFDGSNLSKFIFENFKGLAMQTCLELATRLNQKFNLESFALQTENIYNEMYEFVVKPKINPFILKTDKLIDFYITDYYTLNSEKIYYDSIHETQDVFYSTKEMDKLFNERYNNLLSKVNSLEKKYKKRLQSIYNKENDCLDIEIYKIKGELLTANIYRLKKGQSNCELENYYQENMPLIKISLDKNLGINENAQKYFKKYNKLKKTLQAIIPQKQETLAELDYISSLIYSLNSAETIEDFSGIEDELRQNKILPTKQTNGKNKVKEQPLPYRKYLIEDFFVFVGKNNIQNERLTQKAFGHDIWLHTKDIHSSHVIIQTDNRSVPDSVLLKSAEICAFYSKARNGSKIPVDYANKKYVKKPSGSKTGMVHYTNFKTIFVDPCNHLDLIFNGN